MYPGLYDLLDTPRRDCLAAQLHLHDSALPRPLLHRSRGPPTIRSEYVALQPHLAPPPTRSSVHLSHNPSILHHVSLSCDQSICHPDSAHSLSVALSVRHPVSPSIIPTCPSYEQSVHPPITLSMTRQSTTPPVSPAKRLSDCPSPSGHLYTILPHPSGCPRSSDHTSTIYNSPSDHLPPSHHLTATMTCLPVCPSFPTIHRTQDSIHSLAVVNGELSHTIHCTQDMSQSLAVVNGSNPARPRNSLGSLLTTTYFYMP